MSQKPSFFLPLRSQFCWSRQQRWRTTEMGEAITTKTHQANHMRHVTGKAVIIQASIVMGREIITVILALVSLTVNALLLHAEKQEYIVTAETITADIPMEKKVYRQCTVSGCTRTKKHRHKGKYYYGHSSSCITYSQCTVQGCGKTKKHNHSGQCYYGHSIGGTTYSQCTVPNCHKTKKHKHHGVYYYGHSTIKSY